MEHQSVRAAGGGRLGVLDRGAHAEGIRQAVDAIDEEAWQTVEDYPQQGQAQIAETTYGCSG